MAKRRRLDPVPFLGGGAGLAPEVGANREAPGEAAAPAADLSRANGPEPAEAPAPPSSAAAGAPRPLRARAPIAQVAGGAAAAAALDEVSETLRAAREEGRLVLRLPLDAVEARHLARDRLAAEAPSETRDLSRAKGPDAAPDAMEELVASLRARGQQAPVEVVELPPGEDGAPRWGLVSGWRRLTALRALHAETGDGRFATVLALVRRPATDAEAYVAMVEENEIREALSFWERARIVRRAVDAGAFPDETAALRGLFASASYARRSKIKSFLPVVAALEGVVRFPEAIGERLGLQLARAVAEDSGFVERARVTLSGPLTPDSEERALKRLLEPQAGSSPTRGRGSESGTSPDVPGPRSTSAASGSEGDAEEFTFASRDRWIGLVRLRGGPGRAELTGPGMTPAFLGLLEDWLCGQVPESGPSLASRRRPEQRRAEAQAARAHDHLPPVLQKPEQSVRDGHVQDEDM